MFGKEDVSALSKTELLSRIQGARNLIIGLWIIGALNLVIVGGLLLRKTEGANMTMGIVVGVASMAAAVHLSRRRSGFQLELDQRQGATAGAESS